LSFEFWVTLPQKGTKGARDFDNDHLCAYGRNGVSNVASERFVHYCGHQKAWRRRARIELMELATSGIERTKKDSAPVPFKPFVAIRLMTP
jgi:hypothetical protein